MTDGSLRSLMRAHLPQVHWASIETAGIDSGVPDMAGNHTRTFWVENKATEAWAITFEPSQIGWHERCTRQGGTSFIAVRRQHEGGPKKGPPCDELYVFWGGQVRLLRDHGLRAVSSSLIAPLHYSIGGPSRWYWNHVLDVLTRGGALYSPGPHGRAAAPLPPTPRAPLRSAHE